MQRDVFISYSHLRDASLAESVEKGLCHIGRHWTGRPALGVFRDTRSLAASPDLPGSILKELKRSTYFVYIASPEAAASRWVCEELRFWRDHPDTSARGRFLIALSNGEIHWDGTAGDFDWTRTTAIPQDLRGVFRTEPLWVDLRPFRDSDERSLAPGTPFRDKVVALGAAVRNCTKDELDSEDRRMERRGVRLKRAAITGISAFAVAAAVSTVIAVVQRNEAVDRARTSASQALSARALQIAEADPRKAAQYALYADQIKQTSESAEALARAVSANGNTVRHFLGGFGAAADYSGSGGLPPTRVSISRDGSTFAYYTEFDSRGPESGEGLIHLYDIKAGKDLPDLRGQAFPQGGGVLELSGNGEIVVVERTYNEIELWDVRKRRVLRRIVASDGEELSNAHRHLKSFALSPDGKRMAATFYVPVPDSLPKLQMAVWDTTDGTELSRISLDDGDEGTLAFSGSGALRFDAVEVSKYRTFDFTTRSWSAPRTRSTSKPRQKDSPDTVLLTAGTPDNPRVIIGAEGRTIAVYDAALRKQRTLGSFTFPVQSISASGDGAWVAAGSNDGAVSLFRGADLTARPVPLSDDLTASQLSADGRLASRQNAKGGTDVLVLTDAVSGPRKAVNLSHGEETLTAVPDGSRIVSTNEVGALSVWDGRTGENLRGPYFFDGDGTDTIQAVGDNRHVVGVWKQGVMVVELDTLTVSQVLTETDNSGDLTTNASGTTLVATSAGGSVTVWRWTGEKLDKVREATVDTASIVDTAVSPDGSRVVLVDSDYRLSFLRVSDGRVVTTPVVSRGNEQDAVFSADSRMVVQPSGTGAESRLHFWDAETGDALGSWPVGAPGSTRLFAASQDGFLSLAPDGALTQRAISLDGWRRTLCAIVPDRLSQTEYARYLTDLDVSAPCPGASDPGW
jgi:WD40 repeat protein